MKLGYWRGVILTSIVVGAMLTGLLAVVALYVSGGSHEVYCPRNFEPDMTHYAGGVVVGPCTPSLDGIAFAALVFGFFAGLVVLAGAIYRFPDWLAAKARGGH